MEDSPSKHSNFDMETEYLEESLEDGQEEWLSDGILTDSEYPSLDMIVTSKAESHSENQIKDAQVNKNKGMNYALPEDLDEFLIKKEVEGKIAEEPTGKEMVEKVIENDDDATDAGSSDSGNDTDDLLRMLGDDVKQKIKHNEVPKKEKVKNESRSGESTDEEFGLDNSKNTRLKVQKNAGKPGKAEPEESDSYGDMSSDDDDAVLKRMFNNGGSSKTSTKNSNTSAILKTVASSNNKSISNRTRSQGKVTQTVQKISSPNVKIPSPKVKIASPNVKVNQSLKTYSSLSPQVKSSPKPSPNNKQIMMKSNLNPKAGPKTRNSLQQKPDVTTKPPQNASSKAPQVKPGASVNEKKLDFDEMMDEDDFNEDFDLEDELELDSESDSTGKLRLMEPEKMDEEMPSDFDSSDDESYSEIPTSDSEDLDDWFTIDIRCEKAADYLPLLGSKAYQVLAREKERVGFRLLELKKSVQALSDSSKKQSDQVRDATASLGEIEAMIKAT